ncbi:hypothetical protein IRP63_09610 [Clostridium botulinum]|nr:hypothetical protein [Clostridium botulinum D/C]QPW57165.1 hypothetical protein IRP63_09610 [Clostridium botulinum]MCD3240676.1 hypothetical protein [Clostridium botulinum D/C]MCD3268813.1 hypothetical protein [Clostridium botulinum D/C]MCD3299978.1 hypothetical protein [Clostridium botulinum D/C]
MSKKLFTKKEVKILSENKYVKRVSSKGIIYIDKFKKIFITENELNKFPRQILF